jgi:hypothetical protein
MVGVMIRWKTKKLTHVQSVVVLILSEMLKPAKRSAVSVVS